MLKKKITNLVTSIFLLLFLIFITFPSLYFGFFLQTNNRTILSTSSTSNSMVLEWEETWSGGKDDYGYGVAIDSFDNIYVVGKTGTPGDWDMVLAKYNSLGVQEWNKTWGGSNDEYGSGIAIDSSDNIYVVESTGVPGTSDYSILLVKYNNAGQHEWNKTWGGINYDEGYGVTVDSSDNIYVVGLTCSFGVAPGNNMVLIKYNSSGVQEWYKTWSGSDEDTGYGVVIDSSDNIYVVGSTHDEGEEWSYLFLLKFSIGTDGDGGEITSNGIPSELILTITVILIFSIVAGIGYAVVKVSKKKRVKDEKYYTSIRDEEGQVDLKNILRGMAKTKGEIDLKYLSKQMNKDIEKLRLFVYDLVGSSSLDGKMEGNKFIFSDTSDIDSIIDTLLNTYADWEKQDKGKI